MIEIPKIESISNLKDLKKIPKTGKRGGFRPGSGLKKGTILNKTRERMVILKAFQDRVMKNVDQFYTAQHSLATGIQYLFKIVSHYEGKKLVKGKPQIVTDPQEIANYLDSEFGEGPEVNSDTEYYFMTAERPDGKAIANMLDRTFGKPAQALELKGKLTIEEAIKKNALERGIKIEEDEDESANDLNDEEDD